MIRFYFIIGLLMPFCLAFLRAQDKTYEVGEVSAAPASTFARQEAPPPPTITTLNPPKTSHKQAVSARRARINSLFLNEDLNAVDAYTHGFLWGLAANTNGWKMTFRWVRAINLRYSYHISASIAEITDEHDRTFKPIYEYKGYGYRGVTTFLSKINLLYPIRIGWGVNRYITNRASNKGVFIQAHATGGLSIGMQKPYNLEIVDPQNPDRMKVIHYKEEGEENKEYYQLPIRDANKNIKGHTVTAFFSGWDNVKFNPGLFLEAGARFGYYSGAHFISTVNVSFGIDYFANSVPLLLGRDAKQFFYHLSIGFEIGNIKQKK